MMTLRQEQILNGIIGEYVKSARPISSKLLEKKYDLGICPASIRFEMQRLTDKGFLYQLHPSAGRIPTDKGYRFFVNKTLEDLTSEVIKESELIEEEFEEITKNLIEEMDDSLKFIQFLTKNLSTTSSTFTVSYLAGEKFLWKEGWEAVLQEPEFDEKKYLFNFIRFLKNFEENIKNLEVNSGIKIYIGRENPFPKARDFSIILSKLSLPGTEARKEEGILAMLGPKRMAYSKNIGLLNSLSKVLESFSK